MSANFLAAISGVKNPPVVPVVTVDWPAGNGGTAYYASEPFLYFTQRIPEGGIDNVVVAVSERPSDLSSQTFRLSLDDKDGAITAIVEGKANIRRSRVRAQLAHAQVASADWFTFFDGIVDDWQYESGVIILGCRTDEIALMGFVPKVPLLPGSVPALCASSRGIYAPVIYGIHDDQSLGADGAVTCIPVDTSDSDSAGKFWIVGLGALKDVSRCYKNGTLLTEGGGSDWTHTTKVWGGTTYTVVQIVGNSKTGDTVACDVEGLTDVGAGTGGLIVGASAQLKHFLSNFVYGDWRTGSWLSDPSVIDAASFASADSFLSKYGSEGSMYVGGTTEQTRAIDIVNGWLRSQPMIRARWSNAGELGLRVIDHASGDYVSTPWVQSERDELSPLQYEAVAGQLVSRVSLSYLPGQRAGKLWQSLDLQDLQLWQTEKTIEQFSLNYSAARFQ
jgi:hypothetical protein